MLTVRLILERFDKDGKLLEKREQPSKSFVKHLFDLFYVYYTQAIFAGVNDITATPRTLREPQSGQYWGNLKVGSPPGHSLVCIPQQAGYWTGTTPHVGEEIGIQVGIGVAAVTPTDDALATRILHGRAAGQLEYGGCELIGLAFADPNGQFTIRRYFTNNSGGLITVNEVGIYSVGQPAGSSYIFLIARDLTGGVAVAHTELLRVTYVVQITV